MDIFLHDFQVQTPDQIKASHNTLIGDDRDGLLANLIGNSHFGTEVKFNSFPILSWCKICTVKQFGYPHRKADVIIFVLNGYILHDWQSGYFLQK